MEESNVNVLKINSVIWRFFFFRNLLVTSSVYWKQFRFIALQISDRKIF